MNNRLLFITISLALTLMGCGGNGGKSAYPTATDMETVSKIEKELMGLWKDRPEFNVLTYGELRKELDREPTNTPLHPVERERIEKGMAILKPLSRQSGKYVATVQKLEELYKAGKIIPISNYRYTIDGKFSLLAGTDSRGNVFFYRQGMHKKPEVTFGVLFGTVEAIIKDSIDDGAQLEYLRGFISNVGISTNTQITATKWVGLNLRPKWEADAIKDRAARRSRAN